MATSKLPNDFVVLPEETITTLARIPGVCINLRPSQSRLIQLSVVLSNEGKRLVFGDGFFIDTPVYWFLKNLPIPTMVVILFQGHRKRDVGTAVIEITNVLWTWGGENYPRLDFEQPPGFDEIHGCPNFWGAFILAIARVGAETKTFATPDPDFQSFIRLVETQVPL